MKSAAALAVLALVFSASALAQVTRREVIRVDSARARDTLRADTTRLDTTRAGRGLGIPRSPSRSFQQPDSVAAALLARRGFRITRYSADSVQLLAEQREIRLVGKSLVEREGSTLESDSVRYVEEHCALFAEGSPRLFDPSGVLIGQGMQYDACNHTGIVEHAKTELPHGGGTWYLIGNIAVDNEEDRTYASRATITSCDLVDPHYHFATRQVKWVNKRLMVSRPAVLYVADVPIAWMPFVFQDTRRGRRSGVLPPQFGINDIVRFNPGYKRHITNIGYYFAISDYMDAQTWLDWYADRSLTLSGRFRYRWLDRFMAGGIAYQELHEAGGSTSRRISWSHQQQFSLRSQLTANIDYATSSRVIQRNAVDPILSVGTIDSRINYQRRFSWGALNLGGNRTQSLDRPQVTTTFPTVAFTPNPIALGRHVTWSPSFSATNSFQSGTGTPALLYPGPTVLDTARLQNRNRQTAISLTTPLRIGSWNWTNSMAILDSWSNQRLTRRDTTAGTVTTYGENYQTTIDWNTGIGLPVLLQGTWNLQPAVQIVNTTGGAFLVRNLFSSGRFVSQSKRLQFSAGVSPTLFGLFPGFGPIARIRHAISPSLSWSYSPRASIPEAYAVAVARGARPMSRSIPPRQSLTFGLSQNFEAKFRPPARPQGDTTRDTTRTAAAEPPEGRKIKLLSIQSDPITYDFEQAKLPGRNGWTTQAWGNTLSSDLVRGFSLRITTDLWDGAVGYDTSRFSPYLTSVATGFSIGAGTLNWVRRLLGLGAYREPARPDTLSQTPSPTNPGRTLNAFQRGPLATQFSSVDRLTPSRGGVPFQANFSFSLQRTRPPRGVTVTAPSANSMLSGTVSFSPTRNWRVSWQTSYNFTQGTFSDHVLRLDRDLHDWRASFTFVKSPNGNFLFSFFIALIDEPDLKFAYDQRNVR